MCVAVLGSDLCMRVRTGFVLDLVEKYDRVFRPRLFVIKSFKLENVRTCRVKLTKYHMGCLKPFRQ